MAKEYFSHDYGTRNKLKMAALLQTSGTRGYGLFWVIVEMMYEDSKKWLELEEYTYLAIKKESGEDLDFIRQFIRDCIDTYKVFIEEDGKISTERVLRNIEKRNEISEKRKEAGKESAKRRASLTITSEQNSTSDEHLLNKNEQNPTKETKVNKRKVKESSNRAKALVIASDDDAHLRQEYQEKIESASGQDNRSAWITLKNFVASRSPQFIEPYVDLWNLFAHNYGLAKVAAITSKRREKFKVRIREQEFNFLAILEGIRGNDFYLGKSDKQWKVDFDFIIESQDRYIKILERRQ